MMAHVHYYVHGRGRGHATRSRAVVAGLRAAGLGVRVFAGRDALPLFEGDCTAVDSLPTGLSPQLLGLVRQRIALAQREISRDGARLVISDGDLPAVRAGRALGVPTIAVGHGLVFAHCVRPSAMPRAPWFREAFKAQAASLGASHCVAVNFTPLQPKNAAQTTVAYPVVAPDPDAGNTPSPALPKEPFVLSYFRDDNGAQVARWALAAGYPLVSFGGTAIPGALHQPFSFAGFRAALRAAHAVLSSAGSQLISECLHFGVPHLALYRRDDDEQHLNGRMLAAAAGPSDGLAFADCSAATVAEFLADAGERRVELRSVGRTDALGVVAAVVARARQLL